MEQLVLLKRKGGRERFSFFFFYAKRDLTKSLTGWQKVDEQACGFFWSSSNEGGEEVEEKFRGTTFGFRRSV